MNITDLIDMYEIKKRQYGDAAYLHISEIFQEAREKHKQEYLDSPKAPRLRAESKVRDPEPT